MTRTSTAALAAALTTISPAAASAASGTVPTTPTPSPAALSAPVQTDRTVREEMRQAGHRLAVHRALVRRNVRLAGEVAELAGHHRSAADREAEVRGWTDAHLRRSDRRLRHRADALRGSASGASAGGSPNMQAIAACESGGDPTAVGGGGEFRGKYQFTYSTWQSVGGSGDPAAAPEAEQDRRAAQLYARQGSTPWPVCGR